MSPIHKKGNVVKCVGRGRIGYTSGKYEISFIDPELITSEEVLVEIIEINRKPTGKVEQSNGVLHIIWDMERSMGHIVSLIILFSIYKIGNRIDISLKCFLNF